MKVDFKLIFLLFFFSTSCSSLKMKEFYPDANIQDAVLGEGTYFFSRADSIPINAEIIGEFILKEDLKTHWEPNKERIIEFARENKANGIIIDQLGWSLRGHAFYVKGRVFHLPEVEIKSLHLQNNLEFDCQISVYRDEGEPALGASAKASIKIYDHSIDNFKNRTYTNIKSSDCNSVIISINGRDYTFDESNKKNRYFKLSKNVSGYSGSGGLGVSVGGFVLLEVDDNLLGKLITEQYLKTMPNNTYEQ